MSVQTVRLLGATRQPRVRLLVGAVVAAVLLWLVLRKVSLGTAAAAVAHLSPGWLLLGAVLAAGYVAARAVRYRILLGEGSGSRILGVTAASWGAGQVLPGPGSDAAFVWLSRRELGASIPRGTGAAVVARLFDIASLSLILLVSADLAGVSLSRPIRLAAALLALLLVVGLGSLFVARLRRPLLRAMERLPVVGRLAGRAELALSDLTSWQVVLGLLATTGVARLLAALEYVCLFFALGAHLSLWQVWLALSVRTLLFALPVQGVGGLGTSQVWWGAGLALSGLSLGAALALGLEVQALDLMVAIPEGALGWLSLTISRRRRAPARPTAVPGAPGPRPEVAAEGAELASAGARGGGRS